jgi:hypothetical protein
MSVLALALAAGLWTAQSAPADGEWVSFAGSWSAFGRRESLDVGARQPAVVVTVSGALVISRGAELLRGFRGQAIGFDDGQGTSVGRCTWTDDNGDRIYSRIEGESVQSGKKFVGTITGGTGRYAGLEGEYSFTWQYVVSGREGDGSMAFDGRTMGLSGRVRRAAK